MNNSMCKAQETDRGKESASKRLKTPFFEQQARNKEKIIIITLQGTILNEDKEVPNSSVFLNMIKKESNLKFVYVDVIEAKRMKVIKKLLRKYCFPSGEIFLKKKYMDDYKHISSTLENLMEKYEIQLMITSSDSMIFYSKKLMFPLIYILKNTEWDHGKRRRIINILQNPYSISF